ncbi:CHAD domain-containing protein [Pseudogulbenkiania sp. MAI-1]|uniref:CHAD domain-containing protein n=1 Tax=Pseudogulbenkiania sp. MAI-1 TaxID=990370 RepID=UPI00045EC37C|nr:CHAD domain-containing protein [Pseudogulbenkiania sp. MAI-1]
MPASPPRIMMQRLNQRRDMIIQARHRLAVQDDPEALHDLRIGLRQLRSLLRGLSRLSGGKALLPLSARLGELASSGNIWRDREVRLDLLTQAALQADTQRFAAWRRREAKAVAEGRHSVLELSADIEALLNDIISTAQPSFKAGGKRLVATLRQALKQTRTRYRQARKGWKRQPGSDEAAHRVRLLAKRLRYQSELWGDLLGKRWVARGQRAKAMQNRLGEARDHALLLESLARDKIPVPKAALAWLNDYPHGKSP